MNEIFKKYLIILDVKQAEKKMCTSSYHVRRGERRAWRKYKGSPWEKTRKGHLKKGAVHAKVWWCGKVQSSTVVYYLNERVKNVY